MIELTTEAPGGLRLVAVLAITGGACVGVLVGWLLDVTRDQLRRPPAFDPSMYPPYRLRPRDERQEWALPPRDLTPLELRRLRIVRDRIQAGRERRAS